VVATSGVDCGGGVGATGGGGCGVGCSGGVGVGDVGDGVGCVVVMRCSGTPTHRILNNNKKNLQRTKTKTKKQKTTTDRASKSQRARKTSPGNDQLVRTALLPIGPLSEPPRPSRHSSQSCLFKSTSEPLLCTLNYFILLLKLKRILKTHHLIRIDVYHKLTQTKRVC
jgi:hypothetical protein